MEEINQKCIIKSQSHIKQKKLSEVFLEKNDTLLFNIFSEMFNIYAAILSASSDIEKIFSPGIKRIEYLEKVFPFKVRMSSRSRNSIRSNLRMCS